MKLEKKKKESKPAIDLIRTVIGGDGKKYEIKVPWTSNLADIPAEMSITEAVALGIKIPDEIPRMPAISQLCEVVDADGNFHKVAVPLTSKQPMLPQLMSQKEALLHGISLTAQEVVNDLLAASNAETSAKIYQSRPIDKERFQSDPYHTSKRSLAQAIYHDFVKKFCICVFDEDFYVFNHNEGRFIKISDENLDREVNRFYGHAIEEKGSLAVYAEIREYIRKDFRLSVNEEKKLPLNYWAFRNEIVDIRTGRRMRNDGQYFVRNTLQCEYNPEATCPNFDIYLDSVSGGDENVKKLLWEVTGYLLSDDTFGKVFFVAVGPKDTGKSLYADILTGIIGENATSNLSAVDFSGRFDVAELRGSKINVSMDLPQQALSVETVGKIKSVTGNDLIRSDVKYKESIKFRPTSRLLFGTNSKIRTITFDPAFNERMIMLPFSYPVPKSRQDHQLKFKLLQEASGICNRAMRYYLELADGGYHFNKIDWADDDVITLDYDKIIADFVNGYCDLTGNASDRVPSSSLYQVFSDFCVSLTVPTIPLEEFSKRARRLLGDKVTKKKVRIGEASLQAFVGMKLK